MFVHITKKSSNAKTGRMPVLLLAALRDEAVAANLSISADFVDGVLDFAFNGFTIGAF